MRNILVLPLLLLAFACSTAPKSPNIDQPIVPAETVAPGDGYIKLLTEASSGTYYEDLFKKVETKLNETLKSSCFKDEFLKTKIDILQNYPDDFVKKNIKTNLDAYNHITSQKLSVGIGFYKAFGSAVAYRDQSTIYFNTRKIGAWSVADFESTAGHESTLVMGYDHFFNPSYERDNSLPYIMNVIIEKCSK